MRLSLVKVDADDLHKRSLSLMASLTTAYVSEANLTMTYRLLQNISSLYKIMSSSTDFVSRLLSGFLGEFSKPGVSYSKQSVDLISQYLLQKHSKLLSLPQTQFMIKFLFMISNKRAVIHDDSIAFSIAAELLEDKWTTKKGTVAKSVSEMHDSANISRNLLFICSLMALSNNPEKALE